MGEDESDRRPRLWSQPFICSILVQLGISCFNFLSFFTCAHTLTFPLMGTWGAEGMACLSIERVAVIEAGREVGMEERNAASARKGKTGQRTSPLVYRAVEVLMDHFKPLKIMELLRLKRRTTYIIERIRQAQYEGLTMEQEMERRERERCEWCKRELSAGMERMEEGVNAASLRPEWQRVDSTSRLRNGRKFHS